MALGRDQTQVDVKDDEDGVGRKKAKALDIGRCWTCIDISDSHLARCARGFASLLLKTRHIHFSCLVLKTIDDSFD